MKIVIIPLLILPILAIAQNRVGINKSDPSGILEVHDQNHSKLIISSNGYTSDSSSLTFRNMNNNVGTEFILELNREEGLLIRSNSDISSNTNSGIMMLKPDGKVGMGTTIPEADLHIVGSEQMGKLVISPNFSAQRDSEIMFSEDHDADYGALLHYDGASNTLDFMGVAPGNEYGPHMTIHSYSGLIALTKDVKISQLSGGGVRPVYIDNSGIVVPGDPLKYYSVNSSAFQCGTTGPDSGSEGDATAARGRHLGEQCIGYFIFAAIQLEHNDKVSKFTAYFTDASFTTDLRMKLRRRSHTSSSVISMWTIESSGNSTGIQSANGVFPVHTVDNANFSYFIEVIPIDPDDGSIADWTSSSSPLYIHSAVVN